LVETPIDDWSTYGAGVGDHVAYRELDEPAESSGHPSEQRNREVRVVVQQVAKVATRQAQQAALSHHPDVETDRRVVEDRQRPHRFTRSDGSRRSTRPLAAKLAVDHHVQRISLLGTAQKECAGIGLHLLGESR
jgi:hypothetical protein